MAREPINIVFGANSDYENLSKAKDIYNNLKALFILQAIEKYPEAMQKEIIEHMCNI